jgi:predicted phosphodiesterase
MRRVATLYDIHGNLPALEAVLAELQRESVDEIVFGGDVLPGPWPVDTLDRLYRGDLRGRFIHGNGERDVISALDGGELPRVPEQFRSAIRWVADQIENDQIISDWPLTTRLDIDGLGRVLFCHATPRNDNDIFTRLTPEELLRPIFDAADADVVVCGHTHMQFDRMIGGTRVVNAGSVGMNFGATGAHWLLLGPDVQFRRTNYDLTKTAELIRDTTYPGAAFAANYVVDPPSEEAMLAAFTNATFKVQA